MKIQNFKVLDYITKLLLPFVAILITYFLFTISDFITPLDQIKNLEIKWALDLSFNTSAVIILYDYIKTKFKRKVQYNIQIYDNKNQRNIALNEKEAEQITPIKCKIVIYKNRMLDNANNTVHINYPKWLTLNIDNSDLIDEQAIKNITTEQVVIIKPDILFNFNIIGSESYVLDFKIAPRIISEKKGDIQASIRNGKNKNIKLGHEVGNFKIKIL